MERTVRTAGELIDALKEVPPETPLTVSVLYRDGYDTVCAGKKVEKSSIPLFVVDDEGGGTCVRITNDNVDDCELN